MHELVVNGFDYSVVDEVCRDDVRDAAVRIKVRMARTAADIIEIGKDLTAVKLAIGHGNFLPWIDAEFGMAERSAQNFMAVAERFGTKSATVADLTPTILYALAAPSSPDDLVAEVTERASNGEHFTAAEIKALKAEWAEEKRSLKDKVEAAKNKAMQSEGLAQQLEELRGQLAAVRDENDTLQHELSQQRGSPVPPTGTPHNPWEAYNKWAAELNRVWGRAPQDWRDRWLEANDTPVFDRTRTAG